MNILASVVNSLPYGVLSSAMRALGVSRTQEATQAMTMLARDGVDALLARSKGNIETSEALQKARRRLLDCSTRLLCALTPDANMEKK